MKKLYVLVFLVMTMGKIFGSNQIVFNNLRNAIGIENANNFKYIDVESFDSSTKDSVNLEFKLPNNDFLFKLIIPKSNLTYSGQNVKGGTTYTIKKEMIDRIELLLSKYQTDLILTRSFFTENSIDEMPNLTLSDLKDNPWDTLAPRIFAKEFDLKKSDLTSSFGGIGNWIREAILRGAPLTPEQRFMIRLQKALIEKISGMTDAEKIMEPLKALLLANSKAGFGEKSITDIFGSITNANTKKAVMLEIMKQLKSVTIEKNGTIKKDENRKNTLAELVLENIKDVNMRRALVEMAKISSFNEGSKIEHLLETLIENPNKPWEANFDTKTSLDHSASTQYLEEADNYQPFFQLKDIASNTAADLYVLPTQPQEER